MSVAEVRLEQIFPKQNNFAVKDVDGVTKEGGMLETNIDLACGTYKPWNQR